MIKFFQLSFFFPSRKKEKKEISKTGRIQKRTRANNAFQENHILMLYWNKLVDTYFPNNQDLKDYKVVWSKRPQTRCLASCNVQKRIVRVAPAMKFEEARKYLEPLLYHELCHAVVGIKMANGRRKIHTREFKNLEKLHPLINEMDLWINAGGWNRVVRKEKFLINKSGNKGLP
jgi:hypothetical protein